jgi:energy-converting hydrogenase Eha subunit A
MTGLWQDLNWLGSPAPSPSPTISTLLRLVTSPLVYSKFFCPIALVILGLCAWFCFRQWRFSQLAATLGGLAAALSSHYFSTACWGVAAQVICVGMNFVAVGLLGADHRTAARRWASVVLAGMAVGMSIMEGYDIGAIFSLFVAAFGLFHSLSREGRLAIGFGTGVVRVAIVAVFAAFLAAQALDTLISTQIKGVATATPEVLNTEESWDRATQWSFPPHEILRLAIPGLFGYRMDTPKDIAFGQEAFLGGNYWGRAGETPGWTENHSNPEWARTHPGAMPRFSGGGEYAGILVLLIAVWAVLQSGRGQNSAFELSERKMIWFWTGAAIVSLLLAFGRYAPFYQFFYKLPYFSTIRNPAKFTHTFHFALVILFAYGVNGLYRSYMNAATAGTRGLVDHLKYWWEKATGFDRRWIVGCLSAVAVSVISWLMYAKSRPRLEAWLMDIGFGDPATASQMASFSIQSVGWYIVWLVVGVGAFILVLSGRFAGTRAKFGGLLLGILLVADLARANLPWIIYQDYQEKYATNEVIDFLRQRPHEQRVAVVPFPPPQQLSLFNGVYGIEWSQHLFYYYNIQSLDMVQNPRPPVDMAAFEGNFVPRSTNDYHKIVRRWELTNTRYLLGAGGFAAVLNKDLDPVQQRFRVALPFDIRSKPGVGTPTSYDQLTATTNSEGPYAVIEFTGALPRASVYYNWIVSTNDQETLSVLASTSFNPHAAVIVSTPLSVIATTNRLPDTAEFISYSPKRVALKATAAAPAILLLNDKYSPNWHVTIDGKPAEILRCNYVVRGVQLTPGTHEVVFNYHTSLTGLAISLAALALGLALIGFLGFGSAEAGAEVTSSESRPSRPETK